MVRTVVQGEIVYKQAAHICLHGGEYIRDSDAELFTFLPVYRHAIAWRMAE